MLDSAHAVPANCREVDSMVAHSASPAPRRPAPPEIRSDRLLGGEREVLIRHGDECYRLRHTRNDKLILTK